MQTMQISNIILGVDEIERSLSFYRDVLGLTVQRAAGEFAFLDGGSLTIALHRRGSAGAGCVELVFEVDDLPTVFRSLAERGVVFRTDPRPVTTGPQGTLYATDFRDPDGHVVSITAWEAGRPDPG